MSKNFKAIILIPLVILVWTGSAHLQGQSGLFDRTGIIPSHGSHGTLPEESVDLFTGNVTLRYRDVYLPGPNGLDVEVWRIYNSKILKDWQTGQPGIQGYHQSWVGIGWTMHMGLVHTLNPNAPVIEFPDGRLETAFPDAHNQGKFITRDFLKYDRGSLPLVFPKLYFQNGVIWTFGVARTITRADGTSDPVRMVTKIENAFGQHVDIAYNASSPTISTITDGFGRVITFTSTGTPRKLTRISHKYTATQNRIVNYTVGTFANGYTRLISVQPPGLAPTLFEYNDGSQNHYELKKMTTGYGGALEYSYSDQTFYMGSTQIHSRVLAQKKIAYNSGDEPAVWDYAYPSYYGLSSGTVNVQGPIYDISVTYHAYDPAFPWKTGTIHSLQNDDGSLSESKEWAFQEISTEHWWVFGTDMGTAKGLLLSSVTRQKAGESTLKKEFLYDESPDYKRYGLPWKVSHYVNGSSSPLNYKTISYYFGGRPAIEEKYLLSLPSWEAEYFGDDTLIKKKATDYHEEDGKWGAPYHVRSLKSGSTTEYNEWTHYFQPQDEQCRSVLISTHGPVGSITSATYNYGVKKSESLGDQQLISHTISEYDSSVTTAGTQDGASIGLTYDALGRILQENWPDEDRNDRNTVWSPSGQNKSVTTRGDPTHGYHTITKYWDGMGRDTGYTEEGDSTTIYFLKTLDAEGRVIAKNTGSDTSGPKTEYSYNSAGDIVEIRDPQGRITHIELAGTTKTVRDPKEQTTVFEYEHLPGLPTAVTDAQGHRAVYGYDGLGRLIAVDYINGARTHGFQYDRADNLLSETHPETGLISYSYNDENWLITKTWADAVTHYGYTSNNGRLIMVWTDGPFPEEITYVYNEHSRVWRVSSNKNWKRENITYDPYGNVTSDTIFIPGLAPKTVGYTYDRNNNPESIIYPDGRQARVTSNTLNMPETLTFNGNDLLVSAASYGPGKAVTALSFARNGTQHSATYYSSGELQTATLANGGTSLYQAAYTYDGNGNVLTISSAAPSPAMNASFGYDALNRLTSAAYSSGRIGTFTYAYDEYGNMRTVLEDGVPDFDKYYDSHNRIVGDPYDLRGNVTSTEDRAFYWNAHNQLSYVTDLSGKVLGEYLYDERGLRLFANPPLPEIDVTREEEGEQVVVPDGGIVAFECEVGQHVDRTLSIANTGTADLILAGAPIIVITGVDHDQFSVQQQPSSPVVPNGGTTFIMRFTPTSTGTKTASLQITNNDPDERFYDIALCGNPFPEMNIVQAPDGGTWDFGTVPIPESVEQEFTIQNLGEVDLVLSGNPPVVITGDPYGQFIVVQQPSTVIPPGGTASFLVDYVALRIGQSYAQLSIANNDPNENPYNITLMGYGESGSDKADDGALRILAPAGGEKMLAGSIQTIAWTGGESSEFVKLEFSADNGSTYQAIAERTPNTGLYEWQVPAEPLPSCLIRISDPDGLRAVPRGLSVSFNIKLAHSSDEAVSDGRWGLRVCLPDRDAQISRVAELVVFTDPQGSLAKAMLNGADSDLKDTGIPQSPWHNSQIKLNLEELSASLLIDGRVILDKISLTNGPFAATGPWIEVLRDLPRPFEAWLDDLEVEFQDQTIKAPEEWPSIDRLIVREMFDPYASGGFPGLGGWSVGEEAPNEVTAEAAPEAGQVVALAADPQGIFPAFIDDGEFLSPLKALKLEQPEGSSCLIMKRIALPETMPYDISLSSFAITTGDVGIDTDDVDPGIEGNDVLSDAASGVAETGLDKLGLSVPAAELPTGEAGGSALLTLSDPREGCFYIYSFDGRLLAEYDIYGECLKDYIYMGARLVAEFKPATTQYFYYTQDQIGSTRVVTNDAGAVVYAEAYDPYGGIQKTWVNNFEPKRKFSDKERDEETGLDYFGARYYTAPIKWADGHSSGSYRWLSIDPVLDRSRAIANSQLWNLYTFCANNPENLVDPKGSVLYVAQMYGSIQAIAGTAAARLSIKDGRLDVSKITDEDLKDPGVQLLVALAESDYIFSFAEATSAMTAGGECTIEGVSNLDDAPDWRFDWKGGKSLRELPPLGINDQVVINPNRAWVDNATKSKSVSFAAVAFHELAEAYYKIVFRIQYSGENGSPGAHLLALSWEQRLINQRIDFTCYPGGGNLYRLR